MKRFLALLAALFVSTGWAADRPGPPADATLSGEVLEVKDVDAYTYLRLKTAGGETWAAIDKTPIRKAAPGDVVTATGIVKTNVDLGSGYSFKVLVENATLRK